MARPRKFRQIGPIIPKFNYFFPQGVDKHTATKIFVTAEEFEALRLRHNLHLKQTEAASKMGISQTTYSRIMTGVYEKLTQALLHGRAIALQSHPFDQSCPIDDPLHGRHRNRKFWHRNHQGEAIQFPEKPSLTQFKGWGCSKCGYVWKTAEKDPIRPLLDGKPQCPECGSTTQTYRLLKKLTAT